MAVHPCKYPGCADICGPGADGYCEQHQYKVTPKKQPKREKRLYDSRKWRKAREWFLNRNPLCADCLSRGMTRQANVVDHITPHNGNYELFWDTGNWQSMCTACHNAKTGKERAERSRQ